MPDSDQRVGQLPEPVQETPRLGRKLRKRRRVEGGASQRETRARVHSGNAIVEDFDGGLGGGVELNGDLDKEEGFKGDLDSSGGVGKRDDIDLNSGFDLNLNEEYCSVDFNEDDCLEGRLRVRECIDLNSDANCDLEECGNAHCSVGQARKRAYGFDLNFGIDEDTKDGNDDDGCGGGGQPIFPLIVKDLRRVDGADVGDGIADGELKEVHVSVDSALALTEGVHKENSVSHGDLEADDYHRAGPALMDGLTEVAIRVIDGFDHIGSEQVTDRRKRRKVLDILVSPEKRVLRRSARKGSGRNHVPNAIAMTTDDDLWASPVHKAIIEEEQVMSSHKAPEEPANPPPKLQLPPSSKNISLDADIVLDVFNVYACLRSFSTLLFLSPFELEDFVASMKCHSPTPLFDCIHVSVLQILRKHLECLSSEGSEPASKCLRSLDWDLLDSITWPNFMVEYLLIYGSGFKSEIDLCSLKLFRSDYYKQPVSVKIEILQCLCDDMIEVEVIRSELNRRSSACEFDMDFDRNVNMDNCKKKRATVDVSSGSCLTEELVDETKDWNSDECCLCKMDGSLICCDGCPAAYHSKCVGVVNDHLPDGDWFCPECAIERHKPWVKIRNAPRGAELLGIDPHGRSYFNSCGYLLVLDSYNTEYSLNYYSRDDLNVVRDVLKSADVSYGGIIKAIDKQWNMAVGSNGASRNLDPLNSLCFDVLVKGQHSAVGVALQLEASSEVSALKVEDIDGGKSFKKSVAENSDPFDIDVSNSVHLQPSLTPTEIPCTSSEGSAETTQMSSDVHNYQKQGSVRFSNQSHTPRKSLCLGESDVKLSSHTEPSLVNAETIDTSQILARIAYTNQYSFARTASSTVKELARKSSEQKKQDLIKSDEELILMQMKAILKNCDKFYLQNTSNLNVDVQRERCGWCFSCRTSTDEMDCLFNICHGPVRKVPKNEVVSLGSKLNGNGHLADLISLILSIESRLHGLLLGPWLNPQHYRLIHRSFLKASDLPSVKHFLLLLEANLHRLAVSPEWFKHVDSAVTMGSAFHIVTASRTSVKNSIARRKGRCVDYEINPASNSARGLGICWWRGGWLSRQLFCWKVLPRSLIRKAARQAGCLKIPGIFYPDGSDGAKRSKCMAWRAAVESSTSVEQLALQVRELDLNIRWDDIENRYPLLALEKEFKKSIRLFKKCVIRRKTLEEGSEKYLLDFGKRRIIPDVVKKHGTMVLEPSSERRKFWLNESFVPLHLLKSFEEKRIARKSDKVISEKSSEASKVTTKSSKKRGFSYLFSRAEKSEYNRCGYCKKDVPIRDAVCCQFCKGFFHKRHARKSPGAITAECTYTCHQCQSGGLQIDSRRGKSEKKRGKSNTKRVKKHSQKSKKPSCNFNAMQLEDSKKSRTTRWSLRSQNDKKVSTGVPLRRSSRKVKYISVQAKKPKGKRGRPRKKQRQKTKATDKTKKVPSLQKKRTKSCHSYWLNGLHLSRKRDDERVIQFHKKNLYAPSEDLIASSKCPKCLLCCDAGRRSNSNYIACDICGEWFHGDAYGLNSENKIKLFGFRCHVCRNSSPPFCPHLDTMRNGPESAETQHSTEENGIKDACDDFRHAK